MNTIKVPHNGKGYKINYKVEVIDLSMTSIEFLNVYTVFVDDPELQPILGETFTILQNPLHVVKPTFDIKNPGNIEESNLKKTIAQQIMNNPTE